MVTCLTTKQDRRNDGDLPKGNFRKDYRRLLRAVGADLAGLHGGEGFLQNKRATAGGCQGEAAIMATHYRSDPLSDQQVIEHAQALRRHHGLENNEAPDIISIVERETIRTRFGTKSFRYRIAEDSELGDDDGITNIQAHSVEIVVTKTAYFRARMSDGRARMTIAHELAHAVLHKNSAPLARAKVDDGKTFLKPFEDVEHQAKVFASNYLMPESAVIASENAADLANRFYVSLQAAEIRCAKAKERAKRSSVQAMLRALGDELRVSSQQAKSPIGATSVCTTCGQPTLLEAGAKSYCSTCARMSDAYADGDGLG